VAITINMRKITLKIIDDLTPNRDNRNSNKKGSNLDPFKWMSEIENDTLLFFFGILAAVGRFTLS